MAFSDQDDPSTPRRRRGAKRAKRDQGYDDFWTRESVGPKGRTRRRDDGGDLNDLSDPAPPAPSRPAPSGVSNRSAGAPPLPQRGGAPPLGRGRAGGPDPSARQRALPPDASRGVGSPGGGRGGPPSPYPGLARSRPPAASGYDERWTGRPATGQTPAVGGDEPPMSRYETGASGYPARRRAVVPPAYMDGDEGRAPGAAARSRTQAWAGAGTDLVTGDTYGDDTYYDEHDDEVEDEPRRRGCAIALVVLAVLILGLAAAAWFGWSWVQDEIDPPGPQGEEVLIEIPDGTTTSGIGHALADAGVISNASVWDWYTKLHDVGSFQAGSYRMRLNSSFDEAIEALEAEPLPPNSRLVTVPEGLTLTQLTQRLVDPAEGVPGFTPEALQAALADPALRSAFLPPDQPALEGTLFPETYSVEEGQTEAEFLRLMVTTLDETMNGLDATNRATQLGITPYQALVVASLVEEEARVDEDRPRVARVIYNRLAAGEPLGIDATSCYEKGEIPCTLTQSELDADTPYNTRNKAGLPPTPIASPGRASIEAALNPAEGPWRWYVLSSADGHHTFTDDYDEFLRLKAECAAQGLGCSA